MGSTHQPCPGKPSRCGGTVTPLQTIGKPPSGIARFLGVVISTSPTVPVVHVKATDEHLSPCRTIWWDAGALGQRQPHSLRAPSRTSPPSRRQLWAGVGGCPFLELSSIPTTAGMTPPSSQGLSSSSKSTDPELGPVCQTQEQAFASSRGPTALLQHRTTRRSSSAGRALVHRGIQETSLYRASAEIPTSAFPGIGPEFRCRHCS